MRRAKKKISIKELVMDTINIMRTPLLSILPGQISFFVILSIIPLVSVMMLIASHLSFNLTLIKEFINNYIPGGIGTVINSIFDKQKAGAADVLFMLMAFYLASKATHSIIIAATQVYDGVQKDFFRTRIKAILMLLILALLATVMIGILAVGGTAMEYLREITGTVHPVIYWTYMILKWPFVFFMVFLFVKLLYVMAPNTPIPSKSVNFGAMFTTIVWTISTYAYSFYVLNLANYGKFYGNLSNLVILMIWIYWLSYIFVFGIILNEYRYENKKDKSLE